MKTINEIYKVNGVTFQNYSDACEYIRVNNYRVTTTEKHYYKSNKKKVEVNIMNVEKIKCGCAGFSFVCTCK